MKEFSGPRQDDGPFPGDFWPNAQGPADAFGVIPNSAIPAEGLDFGLQELCNRAVNDLGLPEQDIELAKKASFNCQDGGIFETGGVRVVDGVVHVDKPDGQQQVIAIDFDPRTADLTPVVSTPSLPPVEVRPSNLDKVAGTVAGVVLGTAAVVALMGRPIKRWWRQRQEIKEWATLLAAAKKQQAARRRAVMNGLISKSAGTRQSSLPEPRIIGGKGEDVSAEDIRPKLEAMGIKLPSPIQTPPARGHVRSEVEVGSQRLNVIDAGQGFSPSGSVEEQLNRLEAKYRRVSPTVHPMRFLLVELRQYLRKRRREEFTKRLLRK